jgi:hypothetical protein
MGRARYPVVVPRCWRRVCAECAVVVVPISGCGPCGSGGDGCRDQLRPIVCVAGSRARSKGLGRPYKAAWAGPLICPGIPKRQPGQSRRKNAQAGARSAGTGGVIRVRVVVRVARALAVGESDPGRDGQIAGVPRPRDLEPAGAPANNGITDDDANSARHFQTTEASRRTR